MTRKQFDELSHALKRRFFDLYNVMAYPVGDDQYRAAYEVEKYLRRKRQLLEDRNMVELARLTIAEQRERITYVPPNRKNANKLWNDVVTDGYRHILAELSATKSFAATPTPAPGGHEKGMAWRHHGNGDEHQRATDQGVQRCEDSGCEGRDGDVASEIERDGDSADGLGNSEGHLPDSAHYLRSASVVIPTVEVRDGG